MRIGWFRSLAVAALLLFIVAAFAAGQAVCRVVQHGQRPNSLVMYGSVLRVAGRTPLVGPARSLADQTDLRPYELFSKVEHQLHAYYVEKIQDGTPLALGTADWMLDSLGDPYSRFLEAEQLSAYIRRLKGDYAGIGAALAAQRVPVRGDEDEVLRDLVRQEQESGHRPDLLLEAEDINAVERDGNSEVRYRFHIVVVATAPGGPAETAGLRPGDVIRKVDGKLVFRRNLDSLDGLLLVPTTGRVKLTVTRKGATKPVDLEVPLGITHVPPVAARRRDRAGVIAVRTLGPGVAEQVREKVREMVATGASGIVLDLRRNGEGDAAEVRSLASVFIRDGVLLRVKERGGQWRDVRADASRAVGRAPRLAVLVDGTTAGPAEAVAAALKVRGAGRLFGATTFGLGSRQALFDAPGKSGVLLTTGLVTAPLPAGGLMDLEGEGVAPDVAVPPGAGGASDPVLERAVEWIGSGAA
ncbi:MAG: PDZ domain-containing protein [Armatimonadetes bacterium]|nr:PDZ domain-containing protein [Armatimonadota bacterium]